MASQFVPTDIELHDAWREARLWVQGMTFHKAMHTPLIRRALELQVQAKYDQNAARAARPLQQRLI